MRNQRTVGRMLAAAMLAVVMAVSFAFPVLADATETTSVHDKVDLLPHLHPWRHKFLMIWDAHESTTMHILPWDDEMSKEEMVAIVKKLDPKDIPEDCEIRADRITKLDSSGITSDAGATGPFTVMFRVWEAQAYPALVFFRETVQDEWRLLTIQNGLDVTVEFPCNGMYAVAKSWNW